MGQLVCRATLLAISSLCHFHTAAGWAPVPGLVSHRLGARKLTQCSFSRPLWPTTCSASPAGFGLRRAGLLRMATDGNDGGSADSLRRSEEVAELNRLLAKREVSSLSCTSCFERQRGDSWSDKAPDNSTSTPATSYMGHP